MSNPSGHKFRYLAVGAVFCLICLIYLIRMVNVQITGRDRYAEDVTSHSVTKRVSVQAVRGEIYDRNGKKLVGNEYTYHFVLDYYALPADVTEENQHLLAALEMLEANGLAHESICPIGGDFDSPMILGERLKQYDELLTLTGKKLAENEDMQKEFDGLIAYLTKTYRISKELYSPEDCMKLLTFRCDLLLDGFGTKNLQYTLAKDVDSRLISYVSEYGYAGLTFSCEVSRVYYYPGYASHILGRIGKIYSEDWSYYSSMGYSMNALVGISGCELAFEADLHGTDGEIALVMDSSGNVVETRTEKQAIAGKDIYLTIDIDLQIAAEDGLAENVQMIQNRGSAYAGCNAGALVAMDPANGEILALASYPTYDLTSFNQLYSTLSDDPAKPLLNRATNEIYAPGSTFKLGVAAAALTEGILDRDGQITCTGKYTYYPDYQPKCWVHPGSHGTTNVTKAIRVSCNCFFYELGRQMGIDTIVRYGEIYGLGLKTGIELGEVTGILASPAEYPLYHKDENGNGLSWTPGLTLQAAIGQSDNSFTPLQICNYVCTLLNGGTRYSAHLLSRVCSFEGDVLRSTEPEILSRVSLSASAVAAVKDGMRQAVYGNPTSVPGNEAASGNATVYSYMKDLEVTVGAKTGTAQTSSNDNALIVCAAPYDQPKIVISCVMEKGASGQYASLAPARVLEAFFHTEDNDNP